MNQFKKLLMTIVDSNQLHAKWLNTLSYLENCGARKIAACEHPTLVHEEMLKHAAEEFRHAHHLKKQIKKVWPHPMDTYLLSDMLGKMETLHYLSLLDIKACRYLITAGFSKNCIKQAAYILVTYAIELRAEMLYPIYDAALREKNSPVVIKSILLEEKEHLKEMEQGIEKLPLGFTHAKNICAIENNLCKAWLKSVEESI